MADGWWIVVSLGRLALVAAISSYCSASAMVVLGSPDLLRAERLTVAAPAADHPQSAAIRKASDGHFWADGKVNGTPVRFLVDTGATAVALTPADAARLGFSPRDLKYAFSVTTAAGQSRAAAVTLTSVTVGGARVAEVPALVVEAGLDTSLLGMTYLGRLSRFEATQKALTLEL
jgi:aspartyl protease family protein